MSQGASRDLELLAIDPNTWSLSLAVKLRHSRLQKVGRRSRGQILEAAYCVPIALQSPCSIFLGLREDNDEDDDKRGEGWLCYAGKPAQAYLPDGTEVNAWPQQLYLVFVNTDNIVYNWRWERWDESDVRFPQRFGTRFKEQKLP